MRDINESTEQCMQQGVLLLPPGQLYQGPDNSRSDLAAQLELAAVEGDGAHVNGV